MWQDAVGYLQTMARTLERQLYEYHFENRSGKDVLEVMAAFQNDDGGFGYGLEPDIDLHDSSVIATTVALQCCREVNASSDHPLVKAACAYLNATYDEESNNWPIIPANIDDAPHAPWWQFNDDLDERLANPRAEIAGYLYDYADHFTEAMRQRVMAAVVTHLQDHPDEMDMHDLQCYVRFSETIGLPENIQTTTLEHLSRIVPPTVETDADQWHSYGLPPLTIVGSPLSPFAALFDDEIIEKNLDFLVATQDESGAWFPNWQWGEPETWEATKQAWAGILTLRNMRVLRAFGRW